MSLDFQFAVILIGVALAFLGLWGLITPRLVAKWVRHVSKQGGYLIATGLRIGLASILWLAAGDSKIPEVMMAFAGLVALGAVLLMLIGYRRYRRLIRYWVRLPLWSIRLQMLLLMAFAGMLVWLMS